MLYSHTLALIFSDFSSYFLSLRVLLFSFIDSSSYIPRLLLLYSQTVVLIFLASEFCYSHSWTLVLMFPDLLYSQALVLVFSDFSSYICRLWLLYSQTLVVIFSDFGFYILRL